MPNSRTFMGDCLGVMRKLANDGTEIQSIVTDPPYGLSFMGHDWDHGVPGKSYWKAAFDLLPPGGHLLAFSGTRTYHRMASVIEDAGFEIRDQIGWLYGTGFPKSHDVSKGIDKAAGAVRTEVVGTKLGRPGMAKDGSNQSFDGSINTYGSGGILSSDITAPATDAARQWQGWGTALKPAWEPICVARKPLIGTVAQNVQEFGVGAINIDACRVPSETPVQRAAGSPGFGASREDGYAHGTGREYGTAGRWPANVAHDGSDEVEAAFAAFGEKTSGVPGVRRKAHETHSMAGRLNMTGEIETGYADTGTASRFFYCAKASKSERAGSNHPTVKPISLMQWLVRMVTPPGGTVLDPFAGTGTTLAAGLLEGFSVIGIEKDPEYYGDIKRRLTALRAEMADQGVLV